MNTVDPQARWVIAAIDHPLYSWPCKGLEDPIELLESVADAGVDAVIASYGTIRDHRRHFGASRPILKLDLTTVSLHEAYVESEYVLAWSVEDAQRLGVDAVLTYVQLGAPSELQALRHAATVAAAADRAGLTYVCEIMPVESSRYPDPAAPEAIAAAARVGAELGAHIVKTTLPDPPASLSQAIGSVPVIVAGGSPVDEVSELLDNVRATIKAGGRGVAFGRNLWGHSDPAALVRELRSIVHDDVLVPGR
ncbi:MAG: class I fructose-bisphosphate aldolase [Solirubrobacteraceae bacterium]